MAMGETTGSAGGMAAPGGEGGDSGMGAGAGEPAESDEPDEPPVSPDMTWREIVAIAPLLAGIVFLGVFPKPFFDRVNPSVDHLLSHVQAAAPQVHLPAQARPQVIYSVPADQNVDAPPGSSSTQSPPVGNGGGQ